MSHLILILLTLVILLGCTPNNEEANEYAKQHYSKLKFIKFYEDYLCYVYNVFASNKEFNDLSVTQIDSIVFAVVTQDMFFGDSISNFKNGSENVSIEEMWYGDYYVAGWGDYPTIPLDSVNMGFYFDNNGFHLDHENYTFYHPDTTWLISKKGGKTGFLGESEMRKEYKRIYGLKQ